jgi:threonine synthase
MSHITLRCTECGAVRDADMSALRCEECDSPLEVAYVDTAPSTPSPQPPRWAGAPIPLPLHDAVVSLGEGNTPCVEMAALGKLLGLRRLYGKLEFLSPTGSFKDRGTAVMMSVAREQGVTEIVEDSSGNAGASVSAYAAKVGIKAHVFAPASAPAAKVGQIRVYGARTHSIEGSREAATSAAVDFHVERGLVYASHNLSPYFVEGTKTFAYEIADQMQGDLPEHVVVPVGNGSLFLGAWRGFSELKDTGRIPRIPRLHCIQASAFMPIVAAYQGIEWTAQPGAMTVAGGISAADPPRLREILRVLRDSSGVALAVEDEEIIRWQRLLAEEEGIYAEPTSAAAFAGLESLVRSGHIGNSESVLVPVTGTGLKDAPPP